MKKIVLTLYLIGCCSSFATALAANSNWGQRFDFKNFEAAKDSSHNIRFEVFSTKVGIFTSRVPGYVLQANAEAVRDGVKLTDMKIVMQASSLNTDSEARDEKLHQLCLETESYPQIEVNLPGPVQIGSEGSFAGTIVIRGKTKPIQVKMKLSEHEGVVYASGESELGVKELEIPDPSIAIATLENKINIIFKLAVSEVAEK